MPFAKDGPLALLGFAVTGLALFALTKRRRANGEFGSNASADAVGPSNWSRAPSSEPTLEWIPFKHKIFLSHCGFQKPFIEHLCEKLEAVQHYPFFDRRSDNLCKGEKSYPPFMKASDECQVAILVLSDEFFTKSKWPMMELNMFVKAQESNNMGLRILPLYYKISRNEINKRMDGKEWTATWKNLQRTDESIDLSEWKYAVSKIQMNNGIEYAGDSEGEAKFIKKVVKVVCNLPCMQPDVKWDVTHVQSKKVLCEPILTKLKEVERSHIYKVQVVGLYGMGGVGKTTLSKVVCKQMVGNFVGKVCHVEFGGMRSSDELMKNVIQELTETNPKILVDNHDKLVDILKNCMNCQKVFLVLDNIRDEHIEEVKTYLQAGYCDGSMVLLTSRFQDVLEKQLHIPLSHCMEIPYLDENGASDVLLHYCNNMELTMDIHTKSIVKECLEECYFLKEEKVTLEEKSQQTYHYHPLALKVLGMQLRTKRLKEWQKTLESVKSNKFNMKKKTHHVFSILRTGYDAFDTPEQHIFLDLALIWVSKGRSKHLMQRFEWEWLYKIHRMSKVEMEESVNALQRQGLLENVCDIEQLDFSIHDLYVEFAEAEATVQTGALSGKSFLFDRNEKNGSEVPHGLMKEPSGSCWASLIRIVIKNSRAQSLQKANLHFCRNVEVLDLDCCDELQEVEVEEMVQLRCIVITNCKSLRTVVGLDKLSDLIILKCNNCNNFEGLNFKKIPDDFVSWKQLQYLNVSDCKNLSSIDGISHATALQHLDASKCPNLKELPDDFKGLKQLEHLNVSHCKNLSSKVGIAYATTLQHLDASECPNLKELPDNFADLKRLQHLNVSGCKNLSSIVGIGHAVALQHLDATWCFNLKELPDDFKDLKQLEFLSVKGCENLSSLVGIGHAIAL